MNKPNSLPEEPERKPAFVITCPTCGAYEPTTSPNADLLICQECGTEFHDIDGTRPNNVSDMLKPNKDTKPFKDPFEKE